MRPSDLADNERQLVERSFVLNQRRDEPPYQYETGPTAQVTCPSSKRRTFGPQIPLEILVFMEEPVVATYRAMSEAPVRPAAELVEWLSAFSVASQATTSIW